MPKWALTAPTDTVTVHDQADLDRRLKAAESDPRDLDVTVERLS